jgi:Flp pilus assembly protein TadB
MVSETTVKESETTVSDVNTTDRDGDGMSPPSNAFAGWFASSTLRVGLVLVGAFLLLVALGQLSGIDLIGETAALLGTEVGRWLLVAVVAIALIGIAVHGFTGRWN